MAENVFRRTLRMPIPESDDCVDSLVIMHMIKLERDSPHRMQEWIRYSLRSSFLQEKSVIEGERRVREEAEAHKKES